LRQSEREWLTHRQKKCEHAGDAEAGGTLQKIEIETCFLEETADRSDTLERLLADKHKGGAASLSQRVSGYQ
jgi:uncharacterized protein YecT (DUF1311 family)